MIYSSIKTNWMRVKIMHSVAQAYYLATHDSDFRERINKGDPFPFPFDVVKYDTMEKESCIVGMVMAWSVITLESFVNHSLAERLNNKISAIIAIEYPGQITDKLKVARSARSDLAKKLTILADVADDDKQHAQYIQLADKLSETRNLIVHDKPFDLINYEDGEVKITHLRSRENNLEKQHRYENLNNFYDKCDKIKNYASSISPVCVMDLEEISFSKLING